MTEDGVRHTRSNAPHWFAVRQRDSPPARVLYLSGELDLVYTEDLREHVREALGTAQLSRLILDLGELTFIDSTGIGALVWAHKECGERDCQFAVSAPNPRVRRVLNIYGVARRLRLYDTAEAALETD